MSKHGLFDATPEDGGCAPEDLVIRAFSRCQNYPKERAGVLGLAQGLATAAARYGVTAEAIVRECVESSVFCPTDTDLLNVARGMRPADGGEHRHPTKCPYELCDGSGWREVCHLHSKHAEPDRPAWVEKTIITREQYNDLGRKIDWQTQSVYESRYRCKCHPPRDPEAELKPRRKNSR
jgi:hypothetical protein